MMTSSEVQAELELFEFKPGRHAQVRALARLLPDVETALFFGKVMELNYVQLGDLLQKLFKTSAIAALFGGSAEHSVDLQDYIVDVVPPDVLRQQRPMGFT